MLRALLFYIELSLEGFEVNVPLPAADEGV